MNSRPAGVLPETYGKYTVKSYSHRVEQVHRKQLYWFIYLLYQELNFVIYANKCNTGQTNIQMRTQLIEDIVTSYLCILDIRCSSMSSLPRKPFANGLFSIFSWVICKTKLQISGMVTYFAQPLEMSDDYWWQLTRKRGMLCSKYLRTQKRFLYYTKKRLIIKLVGVAPN